MPIRGKGAMLGAMPTPSTGSDTPEDGSLVAPLPHPVRLMLRSAVAEHARAERRLLFPPQLHVGTPGGFRVSTTVAETPADFGTRVDLVHAMVRRVEIEDVGSAGAVPWVWLTRSGPARPDDFDLSVMAPALHAFAEAGQLLKYVVITRHGWHDPRSGLQRSWVRLRAA